MLARRIITAKDLLARAKPFVAIDATWFMPDSPRDAKQEYIAERLPGARFFDLDGVKTESPYPHMMPSKGQFEGAISEMGIKPNDFVVVYDKQSIFSSPRVRWMLEIFGHPHAVMLDNYAEYKRLGGPLESGEPNSVQATDYSQEREPGRWLSYEDVKAIVENQPGTYHMLDARPNGRFTGEVPEPRPGLASGHVPGAKSLPFSEVVQSGESAFKSDSDLKAKLEELNVLDGKPVIVMCGSGVTACVIKDAIDPFLKEPALVYDGSWSEWGARAPKELVERG